MTLVPERVVGQPVNFITAHVPALKTSALNLITLFLFNAPTETYKRRRLRQRDRSGIEAITFDLTSLKHLEKRQLCRVKQLQTTYRLLKYGQNRHKSDGSEVIFARSILTSSSDAVPFSDGKWRRSFTSDKILNEHDSNGLDNVNKTNEHRTVSEGEEGTRKCRDPAKREGCLSARAPPLEGTVEKRRRSSD